MKKRLLASLLGSTMILAMLSSCSSTDSGTSSSGGSGSTGSSGGSSSSSSESGGSSVATVEGDPVTVTMLYADSATYPYRADWAVWDWIEEGCNVIIDPLVVPSADFNDKRNVMLGSGDVPDIIAHTFPTTGDIGAGLLLPISQYEDRMPNYVKFIEDNGIREETDSRRAADGNYYNIAIKVHEDPIQDVQWIIRTDVFEEHNLPIPTTMEELYDVCLELKALYPNFTIPNRFGSGTLFQHIAGGYGVIAGNTLNDGMMYDYDTGDYFFAPETDEYREMCIWMNKMYSAGIIDPEFATMDSVVYEQKVIQGDCLVIVDWSANIARYEVQAQSTNPDYNLCPIFPLEGTDGDHALAWKSHNTQSWVFPAELADDEEKLNAVLALIDWGYTEEAEILTTFGIEGETFYIDDDGTYKWMDDTTNWQGEYGVNNNEINIREHPDFLYGALDDDAAAMLREINSSGVITTPNPAAPLNETQLDDIQIISSNITDYVKMMTEKFVYGSEPLDDAGWAAFLAEMESKGSETLKETYAEGLANKNS